jgi:hypothetical protein
MAHLTTNQLRMLGTVAKRAADLRKISEQYRRLLIDFAMMETPLVDVDADQVFVTDAGRAMLDAAPAAPKPEGE